MTRTRTFLLALTALLLCAPAASAAPKTYTFRSAPVTVAPFQVKQGVLGIPKPPGNGYVTSLEVDVVDGDGTPIPIDRLMLHHIVFLNLGARDGTCGGGLTMFDNKTRIPNAPERFYGAGEERAKAIMPPGHGYPVKKSDPWIVNYMFMNHRNRTDKGYIQYRVTWDTEPKIPVKPYWLDAKNCHADPVYDVPGGRKRGSTHKRNFNWTPPQGGRIVAGGGHVHGGAKKLDLVRRDCRDKKIYTSKPTWGSRRHPFYRVRPVLHEPGPINMTGFASRQGYPVARGERLRMVSSYDASRPHTRVMGIMILYVAHDPSVTQPCGPRPTDVTELRSKERGRKKTPRFRVPIVGLDRRGRARNIRKPPGRRVRLRSGGSIKVGDLFFRRPNVAVRKGARLNWRFRGDALHNVTVADGPRGFSSPNAVKGDRYRKRLTVPGNYKVFCALHPVEMTGTIKVLRRKRK